MADREEPDYGKDLGVKLWLGLGLHGFIPGVEQLTRGMATLIRVCERGTRSMSRA